MAQLFVGRLSKSTRQRDIEDTFSYYGPMTRCELKYGTGMAYAFVDYGDKRDAEDAIRNENGREICGQSIVVEWARGPKRGYDDDECYRCGRRGHFARDCRDRGGSSRTSTYRRRSRSHSRERNYRRRSRSRSRSRSRDRDRERRRRHSPSYSRSPRKNSRSPSPRRTNGRDRSTERDHRRRSRSHDRSSHHRSHSRSPDRTNGHSRSP